MSRHIFKLISIIAILLMPIIGYTSHSKSMIEVAIIIIDAFLVSSDHDQINSRVRDIAREWAPENLSDEIEHMSQIILKANEHQIPVYEFFNQGGQPTNPKLLSFHQKENWKSISKNSWSIFTDPRTHEYFREHNTSKIIVMGFNQKLCVKESIIDARALGYEVFTSFDIIQGHKIEGDDLVLDFYQENTILMSVEDLIQEFFEAI